MLNQIKKDIKTALKQFGEYSFRDKGAGEVMDLHKIITDLQAKPIAHVRTILVDLAHGTEFEKQFVTDALMQLQDIPDADWDFLMEAPELEEAFN